MPKYFDQQTSDSTVPSTQQLYYNKEMDSFFTQGEDGKPQPVTDRDFLNITLPSNEQGVSNKERFRLKVVASNPEEARHYLSHNGYYVKHLGDGWNFAVQKRNIDPQTGEDTGPITGQGAWKVADPRGAGDWAKDFLLDLWGDVGTGAAGGGGTAYGAALGLGLGGPPGALIGGAIGGGLGMAAGEFGRQGAGVAMGVNRQVDPNDVAASALVGAFVPVATKAVGAGARTAAPYISKYGGKIGRGLSSAGLSMGAKLSGLGGSKGSVISGAETLQARAASTADWPEVLDLLHEMRQTVKFMDEHVTPERKAIVQMLDNSRETMDLRDFIGRLPERLATKADLGDVSAMRDIQKNLVEKVKELTGFQFVRPQGTQAVTGAMGEELRPAIFPSAAAIAQAERQQVDRMLSRVPVKVVDVLRQMAAEESGLTAKTQKLRTSVVMNGAGDAAGTLAEGLKNVLDIPGQPNSYRQLVQRVADKMDVRTFFNGSIGSGGVDEAGKTILSGENTLANIENRGKSDIRDYVLKLDTLMGTNYSNRLRYAAMGARFSGAGGQPAAMIRPTVSGGVFGGGVVPSATGLGGKSVLGRAAGIVSLGTEKGMVGLTRLAGGYPVTPLGEFGAGIRTGGAAIGGALSTAAQMAQGGASTPAGQAALMATISDFIRQQREGGQPGMTP